MTAYNIVNPASLVSGQPEDVSQVLANLQAIQTILNGGIDNSNINAAAAIALSKLAGYPADGTKFAAGDGTWKVPPAVTTYRKITPKAVNNTIATTDLFNGEITVAAGAMGVNSLLRGTVVIEFINASGAAANFPRFQLNFGGTTVIDTNSNAAGQHANQAVRYQWNVGFLIQNLGSLSSQAVTFQLLGAADITIPNSGNFVVGNGAYQMDTVAAYGHFTIEGGNTGVAINTANAQSLALTVTNAVTNVGYETKLLSALVEIV